MNEHSEEIKNKISIGLIVPNEDFKNSLIFPSEIKAEIYDRPYYLLIFIAREDVIKISCFPSKTDNIKKVLIHLTEFSPELVKGISTILKELNLNKHILHTTGLCYEMENCYYETYLVGDNLEKNNISLESISQRFRKITKVITVKIEDIPKFKNKN
jgi:sorbitol-specific phosphotransferase system component IIA